MAVPAGLHQLIRGVVRPSSGAIIGGGMKEGMTVVAGVPIGGNQHREEG